MVCCSNESLVKGDKSTTTTNVSSINPNILALGKMIAKAKLQETVMNGNTTWTDAWNFTKERQPAYHYAAAYGARRKVYKSNGIVTDFCMDLNLGWGGICRRVYCISDNYSNKPWADQDGAMACCFNFYQVNFK